MNQMDEFQAFLNRIKKIQLELGECSKEVNSSKYSQVHSNDRRDLLSFCLFQAKSSLKQYISILEHYEGGKEEEEEGRGR